MDIIIVTTYIVTLLPSHPSLGGAGGGILQFALLQSFGILGNHELINAVLDIAVHEG